MTGAPDLPPRALEQARRVLRAHREGTLVADGVPSVCRFVLEPVSGEPVLRVTRATFGAGEMVLHVPEEEAPGAGGASLQLLLELRETSPERDAACDRHAAAHPRDDAPVWARGRILSGRLAGEVFDGADLALPNALAAHERVMLRALNEDRAALGRAVRRLSGVEVGDPIAVAADRFGFDVRAAFGVVRAEFGRAARDPGDADEMLRGLLRRGA